MRSFVLLALGALVGTAGCALGRVRQVDVKPLGPYSDLEAVRVEVKGEGPGADALQQELSKSLESHAHLRPAEGDEDAYELRISFLDDDGQRVFAPAVGAAWTGDSSQRLTLEGALFADGAKLGTVRWVGDGTPEEMAPVAGHEAGVALAHSMEQRKNEWVERLAGDERVFLAPTPLTLQPGQFTFQDDELLVTHSAVGLPHRLQFDVWAGGVPIPSASGALSVLPHQVTARAGVGLELAGFVDLGLKLKVFDEGSWMPGVAISYDMLDAYGDALGATGGVAVTDSIVAQGGVGGGTMNMQFNVIGLTVSKHFGQTQFVGGGYLVDNHHFLPQSAEFAVANGHWNETQNGIQASGNGATGSSDVSTLPTQVVPFFAVERTLGPHATLAAEVFPRAPWYESVATTGVKWRFGFSRPIGPLALNRVRVTLDLAGAWTFIQTSSTQGVIAPMPYLGFGFYVL